MVRSQPRPAPDRRLPWATIATWVAVLLTVIGFGLKMLDRDITRIDETQKEQTQALQNEMRLSDARTKEAVFALDVRLQNEIRLLIDAIHLRVAGIDASIIAIEGILQELQVIAARNTARLDSALDLQIEMRKNP